MSAMNKRVYSLLLMIIILSSIIVSAFAHDDQKKHDADLKYVLFGNDLTVLHGKTITAFQAIADAAAISIDQFSPNEGLKWKKNVFEALQKELSDLNCPKLSVDFDDLDLNAKVANGKNVTANTHRRFTHLGWNYTRYPNMEFWKTRKQVLIDVVNRVLFYSDSFTSKIPWISGLLNSPSEQCEAFSAFVYYVHILGDHIEGDDPEKLTDLEPLIQYRSIHSPGIITELQEQLQIVFASQKNTRTYMSLMQDLSDIKIRAEENCGTWGAVDTYDRCEINQQYAKELLDILADYIPSLLKNEEFFIDDMILVA